jgi:hypothetical protein
MSNEALLVASKAHVQADGQFIHIITGPTATACTHARQVTQKKLLVKRPKAQARVWVPRPVGITCVLLDTTPLLPPGLC